MTDGMISADDFADALRALGELPQVTVLSDNDLTHISVDRGTILIRVTVAPFVWEWFVDISSDGEDMQSDWADYAGYGETRAVVLKDRMFGDILWFLEAALSRPVRAAAQLVPSFGDLFKAALTRKEPECSRREGVLEWQVDGDWEPVQFMRDQP